MHDTFAFLMTLFAYGQGFELADLYLILNRVESTHFLIYRFLARFEFLEIKRLIYHCTRCARIDDKESALRFIHSLLSQKYDSYFRIVLLILNGATFVYGSFCFCHFDCKFGFNQSQSSLFHYHHQTARYHE
jgi:hypothetical protein